MKDTNTGSRHYFFLALLGLAFKQVGGHNWVKNNMNEKFALKECRRRDFLGGTGEWYWFRRPGNPPCVYALTNECATGGDFQYLFQLDYKWSLLANYFRSNPLLTTSELWCSYHEGVVAVSARHTSNTLRFKKSNLTAWSFSSIERN